MLDAQLSENKNVQEELAGMNAENKVRGMSPLHLLIYGLSHTGLQLES